MRAAIDYAMVDAFEGEERVYHLRATPIAHGSELRGLRRGADF